MTPEQQNIAIAEACGWHHIIKDDEWGPNRALKPGQKFEIGCVFTDIPDYCNDLNAMHEAEKFIKDWPKWIKMLAKIIAGVPEATRAGGTKVFVDNSILARATAAQRAEAFLRTIGKFVESDI